MGHSPNRGLAAGGQIRWIRIPAVVALIVALSLSMYAQASFASATEPVRVAALIVVYGDGAISYAIVPLWEDEISGIDLLERSGLPLLTVGFGGLGDAVCRIEQTGCDVSTCRSRLCQTADRSSPTWKYLRLNVEGWAVRPLGGSASIVQAGDVDAWVWAGGGGVPETLPATSFDQVADIVGFTPEQTNAKGSNEVVLRTIGREGENASVHSSRREYVVAGCLLAGLTIAGGVLVLRVRRARGISIS